MGSGGVVRKKAGQSRRQISELAGWPVEVSSGEDMDVEVEDALSAVFTGIDDSTVAVFEIELMSDLGDHAEEVCGELGVFVSEVVKGDERFFGNEQNVNGSLWIDVVEGEAEVIFVDDFGRNLAVDDF